MAKAPAPLLMLVGAFSCSPADTVTSRLVSSDGLLSDPELQAVVGLQTARDGIGVVGYTRHERPAVRARAAMAIASVPDLGAGDDLVTLLRDEHGTVRRDAAFALGHVADSSMTSTLLAAYEREAVPVVRAELLQSMARLGGMVAVEALLRADIPAEQLAASLSFLGARERNEAEAVERLIGFMSDPDGRVRQNAALYFEHSPTPLFWVSVSDDVREVLDGYPMDEPAATSLLVALDRLGQRADDARMLEWLARGADWRARLAAARGLASADPAPPVRDGLLTALDDPSGHVSEAAARSFALAREFTAHEVRRVQQWIAAHPEDWRTSAQLLVLFGRAGQAEFVTGWIRRQPNPQASAAGVLALRIGSDIETLDALFELAGEPGPVGDAAVEALALRFRRQLWRLGPTRRFEVAFTRALESGEAGRAWEAAPMLRVTSTNAALTLVRTYQALDPGTHLETRVAIVSALGTIGDDVAYAFLEDQLRDPHWRIREMARLAVEGITGRSLPQVDPPPSPEIEWDALGSLGVRPRLSLVTTKGQVVAVLEAELAPLTVSTIARIVAEGRLDGTPVHQVEPGRMVQTGDIVRGDGLGDPGFRIRTEITPIPFERGSLGMASVAKDTESTQFFIVQSTATPDLDGRHTAFGRVIDGMDVVDALAPFDTILRAYIELGDPVATSR